MNDIDSLIRNCREQVEKCLRPVVDVHHPVLLSSGIDEYSKMVELSTKMTIVGRACTELLGYPFDTQRLKLASYYGGCCFLADSFIDDFGENATRNYLERFELLLSKGWFEIHNEREQLFYIFTTRLFCERDVFDPFFRQAIYYLYLAQKRDVELRLNPYTLSALPRNRQLRILKQCARDRGGHTILVLLRFLVPDIPLQYRQLIFNAGSLFMYIDDHGDHYPDLHFSRITYMNKLSRPAQSLRRLFDQITNGLISGLPENNGRKLLVSFLMKYYTSRLQKHHHLKGKGALSWAVYE